MNVEQLLYTVNTDLPPNKDTDLPIIVDERVEPIRPNGESYKLPQEKVEDRKSLIKLLETLTVEIEEMEKIKKYPLSIENQFESTPHKQATTG